MQVQYSHVFRSPVGANQLVSNQNRSSIARVNDERLAEIAASGEKTGPMLLRNFARRSSRRSCARGFALQRRYRPHSAAPTKNRTVANNFLSPRQIIPIR